MRFVLVHMSCAGAAPRGEVPERLGAAGDDALAPDLDLSACQTPGSHADAVAAVAARGRPGRACPNTPTAGWSCPCSRTGCPSARARSSWSTGSAPTRATRRSRSGQMALRSGGGGAGRRALPTARRCRPAAGGHADQRLRDGGGVRRGGRAAHVRVVHAVGHGGAGGAGAGARVAGVPVDAGHRLPLEDPSLCAELLLEASTAAG